MAGKWKETTLATVMDVKHGFAFSGENIRDEPPGDILLTPGNFAIGGGFKGEKFKYFDGAVPEEYVLDVGDLLVTMTDLSKEGDTLGYPALVPESSGARFLHNQRLGKVLIKPDAELDAGFLFYLLHTTEYRHEILASATGTSIKHTSPSRILAYKAAIPSLAQQKAIAHILGTFDDKIELNRRMNETLEQMARAHFKSWFVDFDPVRAGHPLFPRTFQDSQLGKIPKGWRVGSLGEVTDNPRRGVSPTDIDAGTPYIGLEHMPRRSIALAEWGVADDLESGKFRFTQGEILFGKLRPYFHKVGVAAIDGVCSTDILVLTPQAPAWFGLVLGHASSDEFIQYTNSMSAGTKMPRTNWSDMARYEVIIPPLPVAENFTAAIRPMVDAIIANIHQSRSLADLRDALLPKLLSGEIRVPEIAA